MAPQGKPLGRKNRLSAGEQVLAPRRTSLGPAQPAFRRGKSACARRTTLDPAPPKILGPTPSQPENRRSRLPPRPAEGHLCRRGAHTWLRGGSRRDAKTGSRPRYWGPHRASQRTADRGCHRGRPRGTSAAEAHTPGYAGEAAGTQKQALAQDIGAHTEPAREPPIAAATAAGRGAPLPPRRTHLATRGKPQGRKNRLSPKILGPTPSQPERRGLRHRLRPAEG